MATPAQNSPAARPSRMRLLHGRGPARAGVQADPLAQTDVQRDRRPPLRLVGEDVTPSILVAGSDARRRSTLVRELSTRLPRGTRFQEAAATWEVLEHAPSSRIVMLAGEIDGSSAESVMHLLGNRHPQLPVLALSAPGAA